ncbi:hypothetical protein SDC9_174610 [bioreactor metagenome]|uniref:Uncharacterized protein n=1 Tax=bioreactor metagenome TaxID=1076179 RepID=A0A645GU61_9ZZZZ
MMTVEVVDRFEVVNIRNAKHKRPGRRNLFQRAEGIMQRFSVIGAR